VKVIYQGRERELSELCRELGIDRRTVASRLDRGMEIEVALFLPTRNYPSARKQRAVAHHPKPARSRHGKLVEDAIDLMVDIRGVLADLDSTPRRARILSGVSRWLRAAGWR
jgi:hypothetical protein